MARDRRSLSVEARLGSGSRNSWLRAGLGLLCLVQVSACSAPAELERSREPIVYGEDDRREYFELDAPERRALFEESLVALVPNRALQFGPGSRVEVAAPSWQEASALCDGEPFAEQPGAAFCTGILLDWDLVLTAGHCARALAVSDFSVVFDYFYGTPDTLELEDGDINHPSELVTEALDPVYAEPRLDFAWYRLERPAAPPRRPAALTLGAPSLSANDPIVAIGTGGGVPLKLDAGAHVADARREQADYFTADTDTSKGSSGSAAFDAALGLVGVLSRGGQDYEPQPEGCYKTVRTSAELGTFEQFTYAQAAVDALCATDGSSALCRLACDSTCRVPAPPEGPLELHARGGCSLSLAPVLSRPEALGFSLLLVGLLRRRGRVTQPAASCLAKRRVSRAQAREMPIGVRWPRSCNSPRVVSFGIYLFGIILVIAGLVYGAAMLHVPTEWLVTFALILLGAGIVTAVKATRQRDPVR